MKKGGSMAREPLTCAACGAVDDGGVGWDVEVDDAGNVPAYPFVCCPECRGMWRCEVCGKDDCDAHCMGCGAEDPWTGSAAGCDICRTCINDMVEAAEERAGWRAS